MKSPHGATLIEILIALSIVVIGSLVIISFLHPFQKLGKYQDAARADDVRNYAEALVEIQQKDSESFAQIIGIAAGGRAMIGENDCSGDFGGDCSDEKIVNDCLSVGYFEPYIREVYVESKAGYSSLQTGYYIEILGDEIHVGACESIEPARVDLTISL